MRTGLARNVDMKHRLQLPPSLGLDVFHVLNPSSLSYPNNDKEAKWSATRKATVRFQGRLK